MKGCNIIEVRLPKKTKTKYEWQTKNDKQIWMTNLSWETNMSIRSTSKKYSGTFVIKKWNSGGPGTLSHPLLEHGGRSQLLGGARHAWGALLKLGGRSSSFGGARNAWEAPVTFGRRSSSLGGAPQAYGALPKLRGRFESLGGASCLRGAPYILGWRFQSSGGAHKAFNSRMPPLPTFYLKTHPKLAPSFLQMRIWAGTSPRSSLPNPLEESHISRPPHIITFSHCTSCVYKHKRNAESRKWERGGEGPPKKRHW